MADQTENQNVNTEPEELTAEQLDEQHRVRLEKLAALRAAGKDPYTITKFPVTISNKEIRDRFDELENTEVAIAGRLMTRRIMGKASFIDVRDGSDRMQVYVRRDEIGDDNYAEFKKWDLGDIVGVKGKVFRTKMGEISVHADRDNAAFEVPAAAAREVARPQGQGRALQEALPRPHRQPREQGYIRKAFTHSPRDKELPRRPRLS